MSGQSNRLINKHKSAPTLSYDDDRQQLVGEQMRKQSSMHSYDYGDQDRLALRISIVVFVFLFIFSFYINADWVHNQFILQNKTMEEFLFQSIQQLEETLPNKYIDIDKIGNKYQEMHICVIVDSQDKHKSNKIKDSVVNSKYENFDIVDINQSKQSPEVAGATNDNNKHLLENTASNSYWQIHKIIRQKCPSKSILFFPNRQITQIGLKKQNQYFQTYNTWLLYNIELNTQPNNNQKASEQKRQKIVFKQQIKTIQILSFYSRIFDLIGKNDFYKTNKQLLQKQWDSAHMMASFLELCKFYSTPVDGKEIYGQSLDQSQQNIKYSFSKPGRAKQHARVPYQALHNMYQDYRIIKMQKLNAQRKDYLSRNTTITLRQTFSFRDPVTTKTDFQRALQYQQLVYLPQNHVLNLLQIMRMEQLYQTGKYSNNQLPLCININSFNNIQNQRYKKVIDTVLAQNYTNYRIVFIDDGSSDNTLNKTIQYVKQVYNFPRDRIRYIRNKHNIKATFNIINAAYNFCEKEDIQVLVDGDDQLIGKQVFKTFNAQYQKSDLWVLYTFYKNDKYSEGITKPFDKLIYHNQDGNRKVGYFYGHIKTFKVKLMKRVPMSQHLDSFGNVFKTLYDTALQYPFFQLASDQKHGKYLGQIMYQYFQAYGNNDDSTFFKAQWRNFLHDLIAFRKPLKPIQSLTDSQDKQVRAMLQASRNKDYFQILQKQN